MPMNRSWTFASWFVKFTPWQTTIRTTLAMDHRVILNHLLLILATLELQGNLPRQSVVEEMGHPEEAVQELL